MCEGGGGEFKVGVCFVFWKRKFKLQRIYIEKMCVVYDNLLIHSLEHNTVRMAQALYPLQNNN